MIIDISRVGKCLSKVRVLSPSNYVSHNGVTRLSALAILTTFTDHALTRACALNLMALALRFSCIRSSQVHVHSPRSGVYIPFIPHFYPQLWGNSDFVFSMQVHVHSPPPGVYIPFIPHFYPQLWGNSEFSDFVFVLMCFRRHIHVCICMYVR